MSRIATTKPIAHPQNGINDVKVKSRVPLGPRSSNEFAHVSKTRKNSTHELSASLVDQSGEVKPFHHVEIKIGDESNPNDVVEFENVIYRTLRTEDMIRPAFKFDQHEITMKDRNVMIDAMCRYHYKLRMMTNTLYRFIGIFDRYLSVAQIPKQKLRLYACASFLIASKIEDVYPTQSTDLIKLSERAFTQKELFAAEIEIINAIHFDTTFATPLFYLTQFMRINDQEEHILTARYILEIMQTHEHFYGVNAALQASVAVMVTRIIFEENTKWTKELFDYTQFAEDKVYTEALVVRDMLLEKDREETRFMRRKYGSDLFSNVAFITIPRNFK